MRVRISSWLISLTVLLGLVACAKKEEPHVVGTFEAAPCPLALPKSVVQGQDILCGYATVPEKHAHPDGDTIRLAAAVIKSTAGEPAPDPLVVEAGGPGGSSLASALSMLGWADVRAQRDIVLVEQRGTVYCEPYLSCTEVVDLARQADIQNLSADEVLPLELEALGACRDRLVAQGVDLSAYNSLEIAADMVLALQALGYERFNFYGVSFATMLAQHLMRDYPQHLRSVVLDSVAPLAVNGFVQLPNSADRALRSLFQRCASDPVCGGHFPDLEAVFIQLLEDLDRDPVSVRFEVPRPLDARLTGERLIGQLFDSLQQGLAPMLPAIIYDMAQGDLSLLARLGTPPSLPQALLVNGMSLSVLCAEEMDYAEADLHLDGVYLQLGVLFQLGLDMRAYCAVWKVEPLGDEMSAPVVSDIPTLIMSGELDPNTPPGGGSLVAETLSRSYVYTYPGVSHSVLGNSPCARSMVVDFLGDPDHEPDAGCIAAMGLQFAVPTDGVQLEPFVDNVVGLRGVLPAGWAGVGPGTFARLNSRGDLAFLLLLRLPKRPLDQHLTPRLQRLGVDELPERVARHESAAFTWDLYTFEGHLPSLGGRVSVDYALAQDDAAIYLVGLYALPDEYAGLHAAVFLPVVEGLAATE